MVNVKFSIGNKILVISKWYFGIRMIINAIAGIALMILSYTLLVQQGGGIHWPCFWASIGCFFEIIILWMLRFFFYGFGLIVCKSAYELSEKKVVTYLDYADAKRKLKAGKITQAEMDVIEVEYAKNEEGLIG